MSKTHARRCRRRRRPFSHGRETEVGGREERGKGENHVAAVKMRELRGEGGGTGGEKSCEKATGGGGGERDGGEAHNKPGNVKNLEHFGVSPPSPPGGEKAASHQHQRHTGRYGGGGGTERWNRRDGRSLKANFSPRIWS